MTKRMDFDRFARKERSNPLLDERDREREHWLNKLTNYSMSKSISQKERTRVFGLIERLHRGEQISTAELYKIEKGGAKRSGSRNKSRHRSRR